MAQTPALDREAKHFFHLLFGDEAPQGIRDRYRDAHEHMFSEGAEEEMHTVEVVVEKRLDADAIESFLRRRDTPHLLTMKMQLLIYLSELSSTHCALFVNQVDSRYRAAAAIITSGLKW